MRTGISGIVIRCFCQVTFLRQLNSDLSVSLHRTTKYVILSEALAESKNLRIFNAA